MCKHCKNSSSASWNIRSHNICASSYYHHQILNKKSHCLGLGHETMVCTVCLAMFLWKLLYPRSTEGRKGVYWIHPDVCPSVRPSVCPSVRPSVRPSVGKVSATFRENYWLNSFHPWDLYLWGKSLDPYQFSCSCPHFWPSGGQKLTENRGFRNFSRKLSARFISSLGFILMG